MSAKFPNDIYSERETENLPGIVYDPTNKKNLYSEDFQNHASEIIAIEETLGENPQGAYATVKAWLTALASAITGKEDSLGFTPENVANKKTGLSDDSDTYYPSQKAVKTAVDAKADVSAGVPTGGTTDQVLAKNSNTDLDLKWVDPSAGGGSTSKFGIGSHNIATTGVQNIAHGLGVVPKFIKLNAQYSKATSSFGIYDGTTQNVLEQGIATDDTFAETGKVIYLTDSTGTKYASATVSFDSTNIILTWSNGGSPTGIVYMMWEATA